jgi:hypothetical protein
MLRVNQLVGFGARGGAPFYISSSSGGLSGSAETISWTHTTTAATTCLVVGQTIIKNSALAGTSTVTFNGVSFTQIANASIISGYQSTRLHCLFNPPIGSFTLSVQISGTIDRGHCAQAVNLGGASATAGTAIPAQTDVSAGNSLTGTLSITSGPAIIISQLYGKHLTSGTIPAFTINAPTGSSQAVTNTGTVNTLGTRISMYHTDLKSAGSQSLNFQTNVSVRPLMAAVAAFVA